MVKRRQWLFDEVMNLAGALSFARRRQADAWPAEVADTYTSDTLDRMNQQAFDEIVARAFRREGFLVAERTAGQAERGVDLDLFMGSDRYLVYCRNWRESRVDVALVRRFYQAISVERAVGGFIVSAGRFTDEARALALGRSIRLVPADSLRTVLIYDCDTISPGFSRRRNDAVPPACPRCGKAMMSRMACGGPRSGQHFWTCTRFPACRGSLGM